MTVLIFAEKHYYNNFNLALEILTWSLITKTKMLKKVTTPLEFILLVWILICFKVCDSCTTIGVGNGAASIPGQTEFPHRTFVAHNDDTNADDFRMNYVPANTGNKLLVVK